MHLKHEPLVADQMTKIDKTTKLSKQNALQVKYFQFVILTLGAQIILAVLCIVALLDTVLVTKTNPKDDQYNIARFLTVLNMHMSLVRPTSDTLNLMKFILNHPFRFSNWKSSVFVVLIKYSILLLIEFAGSLYIIY
jgi:hypothetical protein